MKILFVTKYIESAGGISGQVRLLRDCLIKEGHVADVFSTEGNVFKRLCMFSQLMRKARGYDVIHIHCCSYVGFFSAILGVTVARKLCKRCVCTYHGGGAERFFSRYSWLVKRYLNKTDANIVLSEFLAKVFDKYGIKYHIIPNILEADDSHYRKRTTVSPRFISVRTLQPLYNVQCIIRAFAIVKEKIQDAILYILSDGPERHNLEVLVEELNLADVHFIGRVPNSKVYDYLAKTDIFVSMPTIDNQPMSVLEAFKCGLLVISSRVGGVPYMVEDGKNGLMVESNNQFELAEKMIWSVDHQKESVRLMEEGYKSLENYQWKNIKEKLFDMYKAI